MLNKNSQPSFSVPLLACDSHFHIFGPTDKYPPMGEQRNPIPGESKDVYKQYAQMLNLKRGVIVQPSNYSIDNSCTLDMVSEFGKDNYRAVVEVTDDITSAEMERLHSLGARGLRINYKPIQPLTHGMPEQVVKRIQIMEPKCRNMGWSIDFLFPDWLTCTMIPYLDKVRVPFTIAHIGMNKGCHSTTSAGFQELVSFLKNGEGFCWIKLTAPYRCSLNAEDYADIVPLAQKVIEAAPNRILWGSDFPHLGFTWTDSIQMFNLLKQYAPDEKIRNRILVDNPANLYGF